MLGNSRNASKLELESDALRYANTSYEGPKIQNGICLKVPKVPGSKLPGID